MDHLTKRRIVVIGAGTAGTIVANKLRRRLPRDRWELVAIDRDDEHVYQPGLLFVPFSGARTGHDVRSRHRLIADGVSFVVGDVDSVDPDDQTVTLWDGRIMAYDYLVIASGASPRPEETPGMRGSGWRTSVFDFYTVDGAQALHEALATFDGGRLVVHVAEMPIKCPVAPLEFVFLADSWLRKNAMRDRVELVYVTPLSGAFTRPIASQTLGALLSDRKIVVETDFVVESVDEDAKHLVSYDGREIPFDLLVTVPVTMGADFVRRSGLGDELNYVSVDPHSLQSRDHAEIFAVGDAADIPTSKAGSTAHFAADVVVDNIVALAAGQPMTAAFDGHANCFVESGDGKALLIDFNYETEPLSGTYPLPVVGPLSLLKETRLNHLGKLAFRWLYWNVLLPGRPMPPPRHLSMVGKNLSPPTTKE